MDAATLEQAILEIVQRPGYQPVKPRVIARKLNVPKEEVAEVKKAIKRLIRNGKLTYEASHRVRSVRPADIGGDTPRKPGRIVGTFRRAQGGYGFVRPAGAVAAGDRSVDIYIPTEKTHDAATGDTVVVRVRSRGRSPQGPRGEIVEILQRETYRFVGTYFERTGTGFALVDGTVFARPVPVGDPGAKNAREGDKVVLEMVRFPTAFHDGEGVIVEVLGPSGKPGVDTMSTIHEFGLPEAFPEDALDEARRQGESFDESVPPGRLDLTDLAVITIDPAEARDFDDAISLEVNEKGNWVLGVHIADVASFVCPGTALDREARQRGTSVYLPDRVLPMLPEAISNSLASLQPGKVRYAKTVFMEFTPEGLRIDAAFHNSVIRSRKRMTYEEVDDYLAQPQHWQKRLGKQVHELIGRMHTLAMTLRRRRFERGALELVLPEVRVDLDRSGRVIGATVVASTESHQIIEEFMLAANEAVAEMLHAKGVPFLRRVHGTPSDRKMQALTEFVAELGLKVTSLRNRFELQELLAAVRGRPEERAVNYALLRSMQRAIYSPQEEGHYALASECYCHFTSPIRRYPDLTVHRTLAAILAGRRPAADLVELAALGEHCSDREQRAEAAERELTKVKLLAYLAERIGEEMDVVVTGVESFGLFAQGIDLPAEGLLHVDSLVDDYYSYDRAAHTLAGRKAGNQFRLGDMLRVAVSRVDPMRRELDFRLVERRARKAKAPAGGAAKGRGKRTSRTAKTAKDTAAKSPKSRTTKKKSRRGKG